MNTVPFSPEQVWLAVWDAFPDILSPYIGIIAVLIGALCIGFVLFYCVQGAKWLIEAFVSFVVQLTVGEEDYQDRCEAKRHRPKSV